MMLYVIVLCSVVYSTLLADNQVMVAPELMQQATPEPGRQSWRQIQ